MLLLDKGHCSALALGSRSSPGALSKGFSSPSLKETGLKLVQSRVIEVVKRTDKLLLGKKRT